MRISPIRNNYYNNTSNKKVSNPNFKAVLSPSATKRVLNMLKPAITETIVGEDISILKRISNTLFNKYSHKGTTSYGVMVIPDNNLREFCTNIKIPFLGNLNLMKGFCVSAGGKYSPMPIWTRVYETKLVLIPKNKIYA